MKVIMQMILIKDLFDGVTTTITGSLISVPVIIYNLNLRRIMKFAIPP